MNGSRRNVCTIAAAADNGAVKCGVTDVSKVILRVVLGIEFCLHHRKSGFCLRSRRL